MVRSLTLARSVISGALLLDIIIHDGATANKSEIVQANLILNRGMTTLSSDPYCC